MSAPFGHTERCAESLLAMPNLSIAGRSRLLQGTAGGPSPRAGRGILSPIRFREGMPLGPLRGKVEMGE